MNKKLLINLSKTDEIRIALIDSNWLYDLEIESKNNIQKKGNIYKGIISRIESSLDAIFVNYGEEKHGFLPFREISKEYFIKEDNDLIINKNLISEGKEIIVQIDKEERRNKGAALTTFITLAGCYLVLMPNNPNIEGISRHIEGEKRFDLKEKLTNINIPENMGIIVRTAGLGKSLSELEWELNILINQFKAIQKVSLKKNFGPSLIYKESDLITRSIRDYLRSDIIEIIIDEVNFYEVVYEYLKLVRFDLLDRLKLYDDKVPLFTKYNIEHQIELAFKREIYLSGGGFITIDNTEALVAIDINSAKSTKGIDIEDTALKTNLEAINEIARQLKIRDLSGLIVIDFIDMNDINNQKTIEKKLRDALLFDRARIQIGKISKFGLLEMSRQRLKPSLNEYNEILCSKCNGSGKINNIEIITSTIFKAIEEENIDKDIMQLNIELPIEVTNYLFNMKRDTLFEIEKKYNIKLFFITNLNLHIPDYRIFKVLFDQKVNLLKNSLNKKKRKKIELKEITLNNIISYIWNFTNNKI